MDNFENDMRLAILKLCDFSMKLVKTCDQFNLPRLVKDFFVSGLRYENYNTVLVVGFISDILGFSLNLQYIFNEV